MNDNSVSLQIPILKEPLDIKNPVNFYVKYSFMITYILLLTTATLTFIEAICTTNHNVRNILNIETCISLIASYFYSIFLAQIQDFDKNNKPLDWKEITKTRYIDWSITTPLMLLTLCLVLSVETKFHVKFHIILMVVMLNYLMLFIGFLGEEGKINRPLACILGFIPFFLMFYLIYHVYLNNNKNKSGRLLYYLYLVIWSFYGIVFLLPENIKNIGMNILDCIAKCLIGNGLFIYYAGIIKEW
jgi:hypothetical protein